MFIYVKIAAAFIVEDEYIDQARWHPVNLCLLIYCHHYIIECVLHNTLCAHVWHSHIKIVMLVLWGILQRKRNETVSGEVAD